MKKIADMICDMESEKRNYDFFDINCWLPFDNREAFSKIGTRDEFIRELSSYGIRRAVVSNRRSFTCSPFVGNEELISWIGNCENLFAGAVLSPEIGFPPNELHKYIDKLIEQKVVLVRLFPKKLNHSLKKWQMGDIFSYLEYRNVPLMLWHTETDWDTISEICSEYPNLEIIIEGNDKKLLYHNRNYVQLLRRHHNLYIETHNLVQYLGIEYIAGQLAIDRLVFGSYFPFNDPNSAIFLLMAADIDKKLKRKIAGENLCNLLKKEREAYASCSM